jgi:hypothetical protein
MVLKAATTSADIFPVVSQDVTTFMRHQHTSFLYRGRRNQRIGWQILNPGNPIAVIAKKRIGRTTFYLDRQCPHCTSSETQSLLERIPSQCRPYHFMNLHEGNHTQWPLRVIPFSWRLPFYASLLAAAGINKVAFPMMSKPSPFIWNELDD